MNEDLKRTLKGLDVVISSHVSASGPALDLEEYLKNKTGSLLFIGHPFSIMEGKPSFYRTYKQGKLLREHHGLNLKLPGVFTYLKEAVSTVLWVLGKTDKVDLYIGSDGLLAYLGLFLKRLGRAKKVVFYTIDYVPKRFTNSFLNKLYHFFDSQCAKKADMVWNLSEKIVEARIKHELKRDRLATNIVVPVGIWLKRTQRHRKVQKEKDRIVFLGHLIKKQGLQVVIDAITKVSKKFPGVHLYAIGTGPYEQDLRRRVKKNNLQNQVSFLGFIKNHKKIEEELAKSTLSVATYEPAPDSFTYFTDPGKIKSYLAAGLPVILTDVPPIAKQLAKKRCGLIARYNVDSVARKIEELLGNRSKLDSYSANAVQYAVNFDWNKIFAEALGKTLGV